MVLDIYKSGILCKVDAIYSPVCRLQCLQNTVICDLHSDHSVLILNVVIAGEDLDVTNNIAYTIGEEDAGKSDEEDLGHHDWFVFVEVARSRYEDREIDVVKFKDTSHFICFNKW